MKSTVTTSDSQRNRGWWLETAVIFVLCFLKSGWPPPDANEAHYLAKARHYWDPAWCEQDFFLDSADAHAVFYWTFGWICSAVSLPAAAWIGRVVTWLLVAWAWQRLSFTLVPVRFAAVLSGGLMLVLSTIGHMAGEWIIGGVEAKGFAFVLIFLGLEQLVRGRWQAVWPLLGGAAAFHVLLGGWAVVAAGIAWLLSGRERLSLVKMLPSLAIGFGLSLLGLIPVLLLNRGVDAATLQEANLIYVFERLPHHLVFNQFPHLYMARHAALATLFVLLYCYLQKDDATGSVKRLANFVLGSLAITGVGIVIDQTTLYHELLAANLLRFYWYRLSDAMIPCGVALLLPLALRKLQFQTPQLSKLCVAAASIGVIAPLLAWNIDRQQHLLPGAVLQSSQAVKSAATFDDVRAEFVDWRNACQWIEQNTPAEAVFLTPRGQQTFKWYANRAEVVAVKDVPQDARGIVEWRDRLREVYIPPVSEFGFAVLSESQIKQLANKYGASYVIVDKHRYSRSMALPLVYPTAGDENESFAVYRIP